MLLQRLTFFSYCMDNQNFAWWMEDRRETLNSIENFYTSPILTNVLPSKKLKINRIKSGNVIYTIINNRPSHIDRPKFPNLFSMESLKNIFKIQHFYPNFLQQDTFIVFPASVVILSTGQNSLAEVQTFLEVF